MKSNPKFTHACEMAWRKFGAVLVSTLFGLLVFSSSAASIVPANGLVALWQGEGNPNDSVGSHDGTTPFGIAYGPGVAGQAFDIAAHSSMRVTINDSPDFALSSLTVQAWFRATEYGGFIMMRGDNRSGLDPYGLDLFTPGHVAFQLVNGANEVLRLTAPVQLNQWNYVAGTLDDATGEVKLYLNGVVAAEEVTSLRPLLNLSPSAQPAIGIGNHGGTFHSFGTYGPLLIDEVAIYSRAITAGEVYEIFSTVPEPSSLSLMLIGLGAVFFRKWKRNS